MIVLVRAGVDNGAKGGSVALWFVVLGWSPKGILATDMAVMRCGAGRSRPRRVSGAFLRRGAQVGVGWVVES